MSSDLSKLRFVVVSNTRDEVVAAFDREGHVAAFFDAMEDGWRKNVHLEDPQGNVIENVRYREPWPGYYGHAMAIAERIAAAKRGQEAERGFRYVDTGRTPA